MCDCESCFECKIKELDADTVSCIGMDSTFSVSEDFSKARFCRTFIIAFLSAKDVSRALTFNSISDIFL